MEAVKKYWFWGIFISILSIFAMSHNANALDFVIPLDNYEINRTINTPRITCNYADGTSQIVEGTPCSLTGSNSMYTFNLTTNWNAKLGDLFTIDVITIAGSTLSTGNTVSGSLGSNIKQYIRTGSTEPVSVLSVETITFDSQESLMNYYLELSTRAAGTGQTTIGYPEISVGYRYITVYRVYFRVDRDTNNLSFTTAGYQTIPTFEFYAYYNNPSGNIWFNRFIAYRPTETRENKEVEQKTQEAVDESQSAGGDSSTSAQTGTTGLLNAITGAVSVISSAQPTNCKINGNMGNLDIGQLDLCANPAPAFVQTIGSLILILMCVPLAISLFNRFISIFRSFQS